MVRTASSLIAQAGRDKPDFGGLPMGCIVSESRRARTERCVVDNPNEALETETMTLDRYMTANGITTRALAERVGVTPEAIRLIRLGQRTPRRDLAMRIERETGVSAAALMGLPVAASAPRESHAQKFARVKGAT